MVVGRLELLGLAQGLGRLVARPAATAAGALHDVEVVALVVQRRQPRRLPLGADERHPFAQALAAIGGHDDGGGEAALQVVALGLQVGLLLAPTSAFFLLGAGVEVTEDAVGLAVEGLAADAALGGVMGDGAVRAVEDDSGAGQAG